MAMYVRAKKARSYLESEYTLVSRPPYFTALAICFQFSVRGNSVYFEGDELVWETDGTIDFRAGTCCVYPLKRIGSQASTVIWRGTSPDGTWKSPQGRAVLTRDGRLYDLANDQPRLLFDGTDAEPSPVETPDWAKTWNELPPQ